MFDPQTAGGLLAALPRDQAVAIIKKHPNVGVSIIGEITEGRGVTFS
jgi:selenide,water dikinase